MIKKIPTVIMLDFNEAFDCINHMVLMEKLKRTVVVYSALHWFRSFLSKEDDSRSIAWHYSWPVVV